jgi:hypothetical protein
MKFHNFKYVTGVIAAAETWLGNIILTVLSGFQILEQRDKKCIELRAEHAE